MNSGGGFVLIPYHPLLVTSSGVQKKSTRWTRAARWDSLPP